MIKVVVTTINYKSFSVQESGGELRVYPKNYFFEVFNGKVKLLNQYDVNDVITAEYTYDEWQVDGLSFNSLSSLYDSLSDVCFKTALGGSSATSKIYKYSVDVFSELASVTGAVEGDIARVYNKEGTWLLGTLKPEGAYTYLSGVWEYGSRSLQAEILNNDSDITALQSYTFYQSIQSDNGIINNTGALFNLANLDFVIPADGKYTIGLDYVWSYDTTTGDIQVISELTKQDGSVLQVLEHREEPKDSAGIGVALPTTAGGNDNTGTDQKIPESFSFDFDLSEGSHSLSFDFRGTQAGAEATIYKYSLWVKRVG